MNLPKFHLNNNNALCIFIIKNAWNAFFRWDVMQRKFSICISFCSMCDGNLRGVSTPQSSAYVILPLNDNPDCSRGKESRSFFPPALSRIVSLTDDSM